MAVFCGNCKNTILCQNFIKRWEWCEHPLARCSEGHAYSEAYCKKCYEKLGSDSRFAGYQLEEDLKRERDKNENQEKAIAENEILKEDIAFLRKWSFVPGEISSASDFTLCTSDGSKFYAHTVLLANRSDVFRAMFEVDLKEKRTREALIEDVGGESLGVFLKFLYTAQLSHEDSVAHYKELVKLAHLYQVNFLLQKLDLFIVEHVVKKETAIEVLKMVHTYELEKSKAAAHKMIADDSELLNNFTKEMIRERSHGGGLPKI